MRRIIRPVIGVALAVLALAGALVAGSAHDANAATGDVLRSFIAAVPACGSGTGTGIAFDGSKIYLSCWSSNVLERVSPADGSSLGPITISGTADLGSLSFDRVHNKIYACSGGFDVLLIDTTALTATFQFTTANGCAAGMAYDPTDNTLWTGCNVCNVITHYSTAGAVIGPAGGYDITGKLGASGSTGIAAGTTKLYLGNDGGNQVYQCAKDLSSCTLMATSSSGVDDLECDNTTFAGKTAIWAQNAFSRTLTAFEIPLGSCSSAPSPKPCGDVNADGKVTPADLWLVLVHVNVSFHPVPYDVKYDVNRDGRVDLADVLIVLKQLGTSC